MQLFSMYYLLYKEISFLACMSFFKRSGSYDLYCFGRVGYKNDVKTANIWEQVFLCKHLIMQLITSIRISFVLPYLQSVIRFCKLTRKNANFICLGEISFLGYKVGKLFLVSGLCLNFTPINSSSCSTAICIISLVTLFLKKNLIVQIFQIYSFGIQISFKN